MWRNIKTCLIIIIAGMCFLFSAQAAPRKNKHIPEEDRIQVFLKEAVVVESNQYTLGEVARLEGIDIYLIERLAQIKIGRSPLPGKTLVVTRSLILSKLRSHRINTRRLVFPGSESGKVQRAALKIPGEDIDRVVLSHIRDSFTDKDIKPRLLTKSRDVFLPRGELSYEIKEKGNYKKEGGYRTYEVSFQIDGKQKKVIPVRAYLKIYKEVYVAKDTIKQNQVIQETDLVKIRRNVDRLPSAYIENKNSVVGKIAKRAINPKEVLKRVTVTTPPLVASGDRLMIIFDTPTLRLTAPGIALAKGRFGERIPVRNLDSKVVVYAKVQSKDFVQVN